ncbi:MAG: GGDEF domain-containing protein [Pirellulales bacterium]|nr:GGDEF domain-containing protein [Pirellulales bacterium]
MNYLFIDISLAFMAMAVGFYCASWYVRYKESSAVGTDHNEPLDERERAVIEAERVSMAAFQLQDLAKNVATDVGKHQNLVTAITEDLGASGSSQVTVTEAVTKILSANEKLQDRLTDAEQKIQTQAEKIRTQEIQARTDSLTKIANRRAFEDALQDNLISFQENQKPFSLLIFDVDYFKLLNDTYGHQAGDEVLCQVANTLTKAVKSSDVFCRYGGEEFALIMPNTKIDAARITSERLRKVIEGMEVDFEGKRLNVTASMGVAEITNGEDAAILVRRADDSVYEAKKAGRNCGYWSNGQNCLPIAKKSDSEASPKEAVSSEKKDPLEEKGQATLLEELPNRTIFSAELRRRISESHRFGVSLSIMHLKVCNYDNLVQEYGDAVGQLLLDSVAQFIRSSLRDMDLLGKLRDGDFIIMLPSSSEKEAKRVGQRVQEAISNCAIPIGDKKLRLGLQLGVTDVYPTDDSESMMARACQMMEQSQAVAVG